MSMEEIKDIFVEGFGYGALFANLSILSGWGIRQLILFFKSLIYDS